MKPRASSPSFSNVEDAAAVFQSPIARSTENATDLVHIAFCCDRAYSIPLMVAVRSVLRSARNPRNLVFWIGTSSQDRDAASDLAPMIEQAGARLELRVFDDIGSKLKNTPVRGHLSTAAYFRLFLGEILPAELRRVIYLDCDVVVCRPIEDLWSSSLNGYGLGAVLKPRATEYADVGLRSELDYFNSGVLLIDLVDWKKRDVAQTGLRFAQQHPGRIHGHDQPALNHIFSGQWQRLDLRWNQQFKFFVHTAGYLHLPSAQLRELRRRPYIIHFTTASKPWHYENDHPLRKRYFEVLDETPHRGWRPRPKSPRVVLRRAATFWYPHYLRPGVLRNVWRPKYQRLVATVMGMFSSVSHHF